MTRGVKVRLVAFVVLSAVGIVYVAGSFLGITDRLLGRGLSIARRPCPPPAGCSPAARSPTAASRSARSPAMDVTRDGLRARPGAEGRHQDPARLEDVRAQPLGGRRAVPRLRAARRQGRRTPRPATSSRATSRACRSSEEVLLTQMNALVASVDGTDLSTVVGELGTMFHGTADPLQRMVDSGTQFVDAAAANTDETITLLETGQTVLQTQAGPRAGHPVLRAATWPTSPAPCGPPTRTSHAPPGRPARGPRGQRAAQGPGADAARVPVQPGHRQPGADHQPPRARADCWSSSRT